MADYTTHYIFDLKVEGKEALEAVKSISKQMQGAFSGFEFVNKEAKSLADTLKQVNAQAKTLNSALKASKMNTQVVSELNAITSAAQRAAAATSRIGGTGTATTGDYDPLTMMLIRKTAPAPDYYGMTVGRLARGGGGTGTATTGDYDPLTMMPRRQFQPYTDAYGITYGGAASRNILPEIKFDIAYDPLTWQRLTPPVTLVSTYEALAQQLAIFSAKFADFRRLGYEAQGAGRVIGAMGATTAGAIALMANNYVGFNEVSTRAGMAMEMNAEQMEMLRASLLQTSQEVGAFSPEDLAEGVRLWAAGTGQAVSTNEELNRVLQDTIAIQKLAAMNSADFGTTVDFVGGIMHEYGMTIEDVDQITEVLNYVSAKTFANVEDLGEAFKMVGPVAASMGISFTESATALALLSDNNVKGTMAGRAFRQMLIQLNKPSAEYNEVMNEMLGLSKDQGEAWRNIIFPEGEFQGFSEFIGTLAEKMSKYNQEERNRKLAVLATANSLPALTSLVNQQIEVQGKGINVISAFEKAMNGVVDAEVLAYKQWYETTTGMAFSLEGAFAKMNGMWETYEQSHTYRVERMKRQWESMTVSLGEKFLDDLLPAVESVMDTLSNIGAWFAQSPAARWAVSIGAGTAVAAGAGLMAGGTMLQWASDIAILSNAMRESGTVGKIVTLLKAHLALRTTGAFDATTGVAIGGSLTGLGFAGAALGGLGVAGAVAYGLYELFRKLSEEERRQTEQTVERYNDQVQARFESMFRPNLLGTGYAAQTEEGRELVAQLRGVTVEALREQLTRQAGAYGFGTTMPFELKEEELVQALGLLRQAIIDTAARTEESADRIRQAHLALGREIDIEIPTTAARWQPADVRANYEAGYTDLELDLIEGWKDFQNDLEDIDTSLVRSRESIWSSYNDWYKDAQRDLARSLADLEEDALSQDEERASDHRDKLADLNEDYLADIAKAQREHDTDMRRMAEDHRDRLIDLLEEGDVRGITKEMGSYRKERQRAVEDFQAGQGDRQADYNKRLQEEEEAFAKEQDQRKSQYEEKRQDLIENLEIQRQDRQEDAAKQVAALEEQAADEKRILEERYQEETELLRGMTRTRRAEMQKQLEDANLYWFLNYDAAAWWKKQFDELWGNEAAYTPDPDEVWEDWLAHENEGLGLTVEAPEKKGGALALEPEGYMGGAEETMEAKSYVEFNLSQTFTGMGTEERKWYREETQRQLNVALGQVADIVRKKKRGTL